VGKGGIFLNAFSRNLARLRKQNGLTQDNLAQQLHLSFQAVSKWETGQSQPDLDQLQCIADILHVSTDTLLGHEPALRSASNYEDRYRQEQYFWGLVPSNMCYDIMRLKPPVRRLRVLDIGCGEGKDAVFFARNGYEVSAFDITEAGLDKARRLADACGVEVNFFRADVCDYRPDSEFDIIFSSGVLHYIPYHLRDEIFASYQSHTAVGGVHALNAFVAKPFIPDAPDEDLPAWLWKSGELAMRYTDWRIHHYIQKIFDCASNNVPHQHCMDVLLAEKVL